MAREASQRKKYVSHWFMYPQPDWKHKGVNRSILYPISLLVLIKTIKTNVENK